MKTNTETKLLHVYRWVLSYAKPYAARLALAVCCGLAAASGELAVPKLIQWTIDDVVPAADQSAFNVALVSLAGVFLLIVALKAVQTVQQRYVAEKASSDLLLAMFVQLRKLGFAYYESRPAGETLSLLNTEVRAVQMMYRRYLPQTLENAFFVIISIVLMCTISMKLSLVMLPCFFLYYTLGPYFERKARFYMKRTTQDQIAYNKKVYESISGLREFRAYGREAWDSSRIIDRQAAWSKTTLTSFVFGFLRGSYRRVTFYIGAIAIILWGYSLIREGSMQVGAFSAFLLMYFTTMFRITAVVALITEQKMLMTQATVLYRFIGEEPRVKESAAPVLLPSVSGRLRFENVHFGYPTKPEVLRGVSFTVRPGERVALVGTSGNGKSTLLKLVCRFYDPTEGRILLDGVPIEDLSLEQLRQSVGYVFQETYLFGSTVRDNIMFGNPDASEAEMIQAAKAAYAHDFIMELPEGYDTVVGERGIKLSGGQKQRIAVARLFIKNPSIVLLDEATSALDNLSEREVQKALDTLLVGRTTIAIAHRLSTVRNYDRLVFLHEGRVAEEGGYDELMARKGLLYRMSNGEQQEREERDDALLAMDVDVYQAN